jgi:amino acid adenylation domain-containing protein
MSDLLHHSIDRWADDLADHDAFRCYGDNLTYGALQQWANRLGNTLVDQGVEPADRVGIYMLKGLELPVAIYGILKAGAAYVPIDPSAPTSRIRSIVEDCGIRHLITTKSRVARAIAIAEEVEGLECVVAPDSDRVPTGVRHIPWSRVEQASEAAPSVQLADDSLAYIMYTSGSTGVPKGLMHTHYSGLSYARMSGKTYGVTPDDRLGNHSPLHFDMSTFEYLTGPLFGSTTVIIPEETTMFPVSLSELIERERLTFWYSVPLALIQLVSRGEIERFDASSLRWVLFGGEPFPPKYLWRLMELWPGARFSNSYGPAEVNQCTYYHVPREDMGSQEHIPIGRLCSGAESLVVDKDGEEVAPGDIGELLIRAPTMMRGYWGREDLNLGAFFQPTGQTDSDSRFYRTGDLVRRRQDGNFLFLGRKDRQIKIRGYRVELDEVENVFGAMDEVAEAAAVAVPGLAGETEIVAAISSREGRQSDPDDLRRRSAERLPPYAVPRRVELVEKFPRTGSGKIDRRALTEAFGSPKEPSTAGGSST